MKKLYTLLCYNMAGNQDIVEQLVADSLEEAEEKLAQMEMEVNEVLEVKEVRFTIEDLLAALDGIEVVLDGFKESLKDEINAVAAEYREYSGLFEAAIDEVEAINVIELKGLLQEIKEAIEQ